MRKVNSRKDAGKNRINVNRLLEGVIKFESGVHDLSYL
ncbi:hypothetical protein MSWAN_0866 [Methanobacterium paludis]|uniref:Uncharacterized protein n=1 Tax=Methanobacterium paludis (strain DSM 25820 / JCM 18151 / SWAN1) TaxID=868131 RepID=F6D227_METPW|nr:hypothetical protein MSWAN_0866 [Methanobacterium paludis]